ncbi:MAG TPA: HlyD family efflux transporter periplasmic adaptor subunit [Burkholderiales bacterium]|nr:HlyD family efflux transporter periplasmic adaptor subunit [Burkholderiales bacterium]
MARRRVAIVLLLAAFAVAGGSWAAWWQLAGRFRETTDNAYVAGNLVEVTPQVAGTVIAIGADDTQRVEAGQMLVRLDPADAQVGLAQAEADLARAVLEARQLYADNEALAAAVRVRAAELQRAEEYLARRTPLAQQGVVSREEIETARTAADAARASLAAAREQLAAHRVLTDKVTLEEQPAVKLAAAKLREAWLALARTEVPAPVAGTVARRAVQVGQRVAPGTRLMSVVPLADLWVDANFKEAQLRGMRIGQAARLTADLYGSEVEYRGSVAGLSAGTGGAFALLPPQNATGNWIKVVQRLPVRIALDRKQLASHPLRVGLSMEVDVDVRDTSGPELARNPVSGPVYATRAFDEQAAAAEARVREIITANLGRGG